MLPSLCIVSPVRDGVAAPAAQSLVDFVAGYSARGGRVAYRSNWLASDLARARNMLVSDALATEADRILWHDADIVFTPEDVDALLALDMGGDMISGAFCRRSSGREVVGTPLEGGADRGALLEMSRVGFGFLLMPRASLALLHAKHGEALFEFRADGGEVISEDFVFSDRWRALGGRIWLHRGVRLGHVGPHIFRIGE